MRLSVQPPQQQQPRESQLYSLNELIDDNQQKEHQKKQQQQDKTASKQIDIHKKSFLFNNSNVSNNNLGSNNNNEILIESQQNISNNNLNEKLYTNQSNTINNQSQNNNLNSSGANNNQQDQNNNSNQYSNYNNQDRLIGSELQQQYQNELPEDKQISDNFIEQFIFQDNFTRKKITVQNLKKISDLTVQNTAKALRPFDHHHQSNYNKTMPLHYNNNSMGHNKFHKLNLNSHHKGGELSPTKKKFRKFDPDGKVQLYWDKNQYMQGMNISQEQCDLRNSQKTFCQLAVLQKITEPYQNANKRGMRSMNNTRKYFNSQSNMSSESNLLQKDPRLFRDAQQDLFNMNKNQLKQYIQGNKLKTELKSIGLAQLSRMTPEEKQTVIKFFEKPGELRDTVKVNRFIDHFLQELPKNQNNTNGNNTEELNLKQWDKFVNMMRQTYEHVKSEIREEAAKEIKNEKEIQHLDSCQQFKDQLNHQVQGYKDSLEPFLEFQENKLVTNNKFINNAKQKNNKKINYDFLFGNNRKEWNPIEELEEAKKELKKEFMNKYNAMKYQNASHLVNPPPGTISKEELEIERNCILYDQLFGRKENNNQQDQQQQLSQREREEKEANNNMLPSEKRKLPKVKQDYAKEFVERQQRMREEAIKKNRVKLPDVNVYEQKVKKSVKEIQVENEFLKDKIKDKYRPQVITREEKDFFHFIHEGLYFDVKASILKNPNIVYSKDKNGNAPLHIAVHSLRNTLKILNYLYDNGADLKAKNLNQRTPLQMARNLYNNSDGYEKHQLYKQITQQLETYEESLNVRESSFLSRNSSGIHDGSNKNANNSNNTPNSKKDSIEKDYIQNDSQIISPTQSNQK